MKVCIKPVLGALRAEMLVWEFWLALHQRPTGWNVDVGLIEIAVPLWNFVFQEQEVAK
jgi:hypothetical protein